MSVLALRTRSGPLQAKGSALVLFSVQEGYSVGILPAFSTTKAMPVTACGLLGRAEMPEGADRAAHHLRPGESESGSRTAGLEGVAEGLDSIGASEFPIHIEGVNILCEVALRRAAALAGRTRGASGDAE